MPNQWSAFSLEERFNAQWELRGDCWEWTGPIASNGYGQIKDNYRTRSAHRVSWELHHGRKIPAGMQICHRCDNRRCVSPSHLYLGTASDNMRDRLARGRANMPKGERHWNAKLTDADVEAIRTSTDRLVDIARKFGIAPSTACHIRKGNRRTNANIRAAEKIR